MRLSAAAQYFDKVVCYDTFNPASYIMGQLDLFDDSRRDGPTVVRRILSTAPGIAIPARRTLTIDDEQWIVGMKETDSFRGSPIRDKHVLHRAQGPCTLASIAQALTTGGATSYASRMWVKDMKELATSSKLESFYNIYLSTYDTVPTESLIILGGKAHFIRNTLTSAAGFQIAEGDEVDAAAIVSGTFTPRTFSPATDGYTDGTPITLNVLRLRFQDGYAYAAESSIKFVDGDIRAFIAKSLTPTPKVSDTLTLPDGPWRVISSTDQGTSYSLHLRRKGA